MKIIKTLHNLTPDDKGCVIAIGNFDGMHRGHQALIARTRALAQQKNLPCGVLTFEPHPRHLFRPDDPPFRITPPALKEQKIRQSGVDILFSLTFDWDFASQSAADFVRHVLEDGLAPAHIVVGADFCFGQLRKGTPQTLEQAGFDVTIADNIANDHQTRISSSAIRQALRHGDLAGAGDLLGWPWEIQGCVVQGDRRGRELGYPTANIALHDTLHPAYGVYAAYVQIADDGTDAPWMRAAVNIGIRPMFALKTGQLEAHILDFDRDIYGKILRVRPVQKLRGEAKFDSLDALIGQIAADCAQVRKILKK